MDEYESLARYNIAETCAAPVSLEELQELSEEKSSKIWNPSTKLSYGSIRGSPQLRSNLASLYSSKSSSPITGDHILITPGAIAANLSAFYGLVRKGDHVICHYPTYQQLCEVPASLGAEVDFWRAREDRQWQLDLAELEALMRPNTKMIIIKYILFPVSYETFSSSLPQQPQQPNRRHHPKTNASFPGKACRNA